MAMEKASGRPVAVDAGWSTRARSEGVWLCGDLMYSTKPLATAFAVFSAWAAVRLVALIWRIPVVGFFTTISLARAVLEIGGEMCGRARVSTGSLWATTARVAALLEEFWLVGVTIRTSAVLTRLGGWSTA